MTNTNAERLIHVSREERWQGAAEKIAEFLCEVLIANDMALEATDEDDIRIIAAGDKPGCIRFVMPMPGTVSFVKCEEADCQYNSCSNDTGELLSAAEGLRNILAECDLIIEACGVEVRMTDGSSYMEQNLILINTVYEDACLLRIGEGSLQLHELQIEVSERDNRSLN